MSGQSNVLKPWAALSCNPLPNGDVSPTPLNVLVAQCHFLRSAKNKFKRFIHQPLSNDDEYGDSKLDF